MIVQLIFVVAACIGLGGVGIYFHMTTQRRKRIPVVTPVYEVEMPTLSASHIGSPAVKDQSVRVEAGNALSRSQETLYYSIPNTPLVSPLPPRRPRLDRRPSTFVHFASPVIAAKTDDSEDEDGYFYIEYYNAEHRID